MSTIRKILVLIWILPLTAPCGLAIFTFPLVVAMRWVTPARSAYMWQKPGPVETVRVPLSGIAPALRNSVVAAEDAHFFFHHGLDFKEMRASWEKNAKKKRYARGFSTITMQLSRNLFLTPHKSLVRKAVEIFIALEMELLIPKARILEIYLNVIEWGRGIYGAEAASRHYFKKPARDLGPSEAAFLAAIIPSPIRWGHWPPGPYVQKRMRSILSGAAEVDDATPDEPAEEEP